MRVNPLVSILVPCFDAGPWLSDMLESALAQTWPHREVIVVNDGSRDNSLSIARSFEARGVRVIDQPNRGQCAALNRALGEAKGDYLAFVDADDLVARDKIALQVARLAEAGPEFVASGEWARFRDRPEDAVFAPEPIWRDLAPVDWLVASWMGGGMMHGATWLVPRKVAQRAGFFWNEELSLINDLDYFTRIVLASRGVLFCAGARTYYRTGHARSLSGGTSPKAFASGFCALQLSREALLRVEDSPRTRLACATALQRFIYWAYPGGREFLKGAEKEVRRLGGTSLAPTGGRALQLASRLLGWKAARRLERLQTAMGLGNTKPPAARSWTPQGTH